MKSVCFIELETQMAKGALAATLFGRISADTAKERIGQLCKAWLVIGGVQALVFFLLLLNGRGDPLLGALSTLLAAVGGYFLGARKSRAVAVVLFIYSLSVAIPAVAGFSRRPNAVGIALAALFVLISWRGLRATWVYHRAMGLRTAWKRVVLISGLATLVSILAFIGMAVAVAILHPDSRDESVKRLMGELFMILVGLSFVLIVAPLTRRYPFARRPEAIEVAGVFD